MSLPIPSRPDWQQHAACRGCTDLFFPSRGEDTRPALAICNTCPVRTECLDHALELGEKYGIWGGEPERQRRRLRRGRPRPPRPTQCNHHGCTNLPVAAGLCRRHRTPRDP